LSGRWNEPGGRGTWRGPWVRADRGIQDGQMVLEGVTLEVGGKGGLR